MHNTNTIQHGISCRKQVSLCQATLYSKTKKIHSCTYTTGLFLTATRGSSTAETGRRCFVQQHTADILKKSYDYLPR